MLHRLKLAVIGLLLCATVLADDPKKVVYDRTEALPNGIAFYMTLGMLNKANSSNRDIALAIVKQKLKTDNAEIILDEFLATFQQIRNEIRLAETTHACRTNEGMDAGDLLNDMDGITESITDAYYDSTKDSFDSLTGARFREWMEASKMGIVYTRTENRAGELAAQGISADEVIGPMCQRGVRQ